MVMYRVFVEFVHKSEKVLVAWSDFKIYSMGHLSPIDFNFL